MTAGMDATDIIDALGGYTELARTLNIGRSTVFMWHAAGIPKARCLELAELAQSRGLGDITLEVLMQSKARPKVDAASQKKPRKKPKRRAGPRKRA